MIRLFLEIVSRLREKENETMVRFSRVNRVAGFRSISIVFDGGFCVLLPRLFYGLDDASREARLAGVTRRFLIGPSVHREK